MTHAQAKAAAEAFAEATRQELATKGDLREVEARLEARIETAAANLKVDIIRWLSVTQLALGGFILATIKFVK